VPEKETLYLLGWPLVLSIRVDGQPADAQPYLDKINDVARAEELF
jgi:hypothetical protein